jgi:predicted SnoaL-like aldol condensation-catalyzing enzyme
MPRRSKSKTTTATGNKHEPSLCRTQLTRSTMNESIESKNKATVLKAFNLLFNQHDLDAAKEFWSPDYIQHSAHIPPGRDGLFALAGSLPPSARYENHVIFAEGDLVMTHGRFTGTGGAANLIAADIMRLKDGVLVEHWDVLQDEVTKAQSKSGNPMFGDSFPS